MGLGNFLSGVGIAMGHNIDWNTQNDMNQANIALKQQAVEQGKLQMQTQQQQNILRQQIGQQITQEKAAQSVGIVDPMQEAKLWRSAEGKFTVTGDFAAAARAGKQADELVAQSKEALLQTTKLQQAAKEGLSTAAQDFLANPAPANAAAVARAAIAAGVNPLDIPPPNSPSFPAWAKTQQMASMTGAKRVEFLQKEADMGENRKMRQQIHEDSLQSQREARAATAANREQMIQLRKSEQASRVQDRTARTQFQESEKLNSTLQSAAKPFLEDRQNITDLKGLLAVDSSVADQQLHQDLTALSGHFKGRATNLFYKDNKNFGSVVQRLSGMASHAFTGRYDEQSRKDIYDMLDKLQHTVIDPSLSALEKDQQKKAEKYGLDPSMVQVQGDFSRDGSAPKPSAGNIPPDIQDLLHKYGKK